jgi:hypothetical protein
MESQEFVKKLTEAQELMSKENYKDAIAILEELKKIEENGDFDYSLTHKLYQLISNSKSLFNQQKILKFIKILSKKEKNISIDKLLEVVSKEIDIKMDILRREIELLILRGLISCNFDGNTLKFL